jgi:HK97 family phage portal protein
MTSLATIPRKRFPRRAPDQADDQERGMSFFQHFGGGSFGGTAFDGPNLSGVQVDEFSSMGATPIYNAVTLISSSLALMDLYIAEILPGDSMRVAKEHPAYDLVHSKANDHMTAYISRQTVVGHTCLGGNGYWEVERTKKGRPKAFHVLEPANTQIQLEPRSHRLNYHLVRENKDLSPRDVIHFKMWGYDGITGASPIRTANEAVALTIARERWEASMLGKGARAEGFLELPGVTDEIKAGKYREAWNKVHGGPESAGQVGLLTNGAKFVPTSWSPEAMQITAARLFSIAEVGRMYNIPQHMLGNLERATLANIEEQNIAFYQLTLMPWITMIEQELNLKLFSNQERRRFQVRHDPTSFLKANLTALIARDKSDFETGQASTNELRVRNGKPKLDHPNADKHYIPGNNLIAIEDMQPPQPVDQTDPDDASELIEGTAPDDDQADAVRGVLADALSRWATKETNAVERAARTADPLASIRAFYERERPKLAAALAPGLKVVRTVLKSALSPEDAAATIHQGITIELEEIVKTVEPDELPGAITRHFARRGANHARDQADKLTRKGSA